MPTWNGFEFLDELKNLPAHQQVKIVMLTTSLNPADLERAQSYGILDYLEKPLTQEKLKALINKRP